MSNDVYAAMLARGFTGEMRAYRAYRDDAPATGSRSPVRSRDRSRPCSAVDGSA